MTAVTLDADYLSVYLSLPPQTFTSIVDAPTAELVRSVLEAITKKAREHDELVADKLRVDIELENAVRSSETRIEGLRSTIEKSQKTVEELRTKLKEEENARSSCENEFQTLKSSSTTSSSEVESLRTRIASLESANRDTIAVLESKTTANDSLAQDLQKQHQKGLELSQQIAALQQSVQNAESAASSSKFREQSLRQELELAKRSNEWFENELKTKSAEALKYRKEKGARLAELQRQNEELSSNVEALKRTEQALRSRLDELQKKAEDSLSKVQQLQEAAAKTEEGFQQELESARRLAQLQSQQTETHRNRLRDVEAALEKAKDDAADEVGRSRQEAEAERQEREQADHRIAELETEVDRLEAQIAAQSHISSVPGTPRAGLNGSMPGHVGSPAQFGTPGSLRSKSAITATQAIEELYKVKGQLATEKRQNERLRAEMDEMIQGLEAKGPEMEEMQAENERLQQEVVEMSKFVDQIGKERDRAKKDARKLESEASTSQAEANILRQQLRDLSAQIKMLLCDLDAKERGLDALSAVERSELERLARGEVSEEALEGLTDTDRFISQRLTVFQSISELQEKNQELLKITRQLGAQMESEEALAAKHQAAKDHEEVQTLQLKIENYKDELQNMITRSESYIKERDMFRRMLQHRGQLPPTSDLASIFGQSVDGSQNGIIPTIEQQSGSRDSTNHVAALRELQGQFDQYREEMATDRRTIKEQSEKLSQEKSFLQTEIAKVNSQLTLANERYEMLHSNYSMLQNENKELQKRSQILSEAAAKQDLRTQQVAEDLVEAKAMVESMRNENANLKAEKKLWKDIQDRLSQDNEGLANERSRLNTLIANQQTLQNERELSDSETRRRLQAQVESLEAELSTTKRKLGDEVEENKRAQLRKEYDSQQNQKRIDDLATSLSQVREELVAAKTTRDHLQSRVDELTIELKNAKERVELLQPRPTPRPGTSGQIGVDTNENVEDEALSREQELAIEVSEWKRKLDLSKSDLDSMKSQMEQYRSISQSSEEELQSINATHDQYCEEMDRVLQEKNSQIQELQQRVDDISTELTTTNNELTALRNQQTEIARQVEGEKVSLQTEISRLKDENERHATAAQFHQQDLRAQAAIATKAQQDYENELLKHAEAAKLLQNLRADHNQLKTVCATFKAEAESAKVTLSQSEISWEELRAQFEQELTELRTRRDDVDAQNKLLHQQLDNLGSQISALQQSRANLAATTDAPSPSAEFTNDRNADGLRELNTFLRREKEIVEVQYDLKVQESKRLQQQLDYAQSQLDESRLKLDQERRLHADGGRSSIAHKDLMEKLNELNLFRESSITLRNEARQAQAQLAEKSKQVEELMGQIQPLESKIRELQHVKETMDGEMRLLQEDRDRWQKRTQDIISKHDRIDPAEMEQLKETIESLRAEKDALLEEQQPLQEKLHAIEAEKATWSQSRQKLVDQAKERNRTQLKAIGDRTTERDAAVQERETLQQQLSSFKQELETAVQEKNVAEQKVASLKQEIEGIKNERDRALAIVSEASSDQPPAASVAESRVKDTLNQRLVELTNDLDAAKNENKSLETQLTELRAQLANVTSERDRAAVDAAEARAQQKPQISGDAADSSQEEGQINEIANNRISDQEKKLLEERIEVAEAKAKEQEEKALQIELQMENTIKTRSEKMKAQVNKRLAELKESQRAELEAEYKLKFEQQKQILSAELKAPSTIAAASPAPVKATESTAPATPLTPTQKPPGGPSFDGSSLSDAQVRELLSTNPTIKGILASNLKKKLETETQKLKEDYERITADKLAEAQQKAESAQTQAVMMAEKKSSLRLNMAENRSKVAAAKIDVVETAAKETPDKPVSEVWEVAKTARPPPPVVSTAPVSQPNGTSPPISKPLEVKAEGPSTGIPQAQVQPPKIPVGSNGIHSAPVSNIPSAPSAGISNIRPPTQIPQMRGGAGIRAGRGGVPGTRGRGGGGRGGLNATAQNFSPPGQAGQKRPREEGSIGGQQQGNGGKRARGGGQNI